MTAHEQARVFMEALYGNKPAGTLIAISEKNGTGWGQSWFENTIDKALAHVVGAVDVYTRISVLDSRPRKGRGTEAASTSIPGLWVEFDLNGAPNGRGGTIVGGFESIDAALDLADSVLSLTLAVCSGFGAHGYLLLEQPLLLPGQEERARAKALVQRYQATVRERAKAIGVQKLDSTHDLTRVFRPCGSFNGKGDKPAPVVLLARGGPRYAIEQLEELLPTVEPKNPAQKVTKKNISTANAETSKKTTAKGIFDAHPKLRKIAGREGKAPGDGTGHAWDFYLACEGARRGLDDDELAELVRGARALHGDEKGERADYVERTVGAARAQVPYLDGPASSDEQREALALAISRRWRIESDPIVSGRIIGREDAGGGVVLLTRRSGAILRFGRLATLFDPKAHTRAVSIMAGTPVVPLTNEEAVRVAQQVIALAKIEALDGADEARQWVREFIDEVGAIVDVKLEGTADEKWASLIKRETEQDKLASRVIAARTAAMRDEQGRLWLPAGALRPSIGAGGKGPDWPQLIARLAEIGWERKEIDTWEPGIPHCERVGDKRVKIVFFVDPEDWT